MSMDTSQPSDIADEQEDCASLCSEVSEDGLQCIKRLYKTQAGHYIDHAGGHFFTSSRGKDILYNYHYDATAFLSGQPVSYHKPEECDGTGFCAWRNSAGE